MRGASAAERLALAASPYHRYMLARGTAAVREPAAAPGDLHLAHGAGRDPRALRPSARAPADRSTTRSTRSVFSPGLARHRDETFARATASPREACVFLLVGSEYARKGVGRAIEALAHVPRACASPRRRHATVIRRATLRLRDACGVAHRVTFAGAQTDPAPVLRRRRRVRAADALRCAVQRGAGSAGVRIAGGHERSLRRRRARARRMAPARLRRARHRGDRRGDARAARARRRARRREQAQRSRPCAELTPAAMAARSRCRLYESLLARR